MLINAKVIRKIQGFYFVCTNSNYTSISEFENSLLKCKLRGNLKNSNKKDNCVIGDNVLIDSELNTIEKIFERKNILIRPLVSNIESIALCYSAKEPNFDIIQFQKNLLHIHNNNLDFILIITKSDLLNKEELENLKNIIESNFSYIKTFFISTKNDDISTLEKYISNKNIIISGPSGVGKSTLINHILKEKILKTDEVSKKTKKGKNTTVDTRFFPYKNGFIIDTPGFSSLEFPNFKNILEIKNFFPEIETLHYNCKFTNCTHLSEPNCAVKKNLTNIRYEFYKLIISNLKK